MKRTTKADTPKGTLLAHTAEEDVARTSKRSQRPRMSPATPSFWTRYVDSRLKQFNAGR